MSIFEKIVNDLNNLDSNANIMLYFTQKNKLGYTTYMPNVKNSLSSELLDLIRGNIEEYVSAEMAEFNPTSYREGVVETCNIDYVGNFQEVLDSFADPDHVDTGLDANDLTFYCIEIKNEKFDYKFFRRITKFRRLSSKGILAWFSGNTLNKMEQQMLGLDGFIDLVCVGNDIYVFNHISLERIFRLVEKYSNKAKEALQKLRDADGISNFDQFEEDCLSDQRYHKTLSKMMENNNQFGDVFNDFSSIRQVIDMFDLDIEIEKCGDKTRLRYEDKHQRMDILRIINDAYYRSIIGKRKGIDDN